MRYKQEIDRSLEETENFLAMAAAELQSGKPYVTAEYIAQRLSLIREKVEIARHYLTLEDE